MTVSVVMATYNGENFIEEQLSSILNQSRKVDEIVIVDDASSDKTVSIIETFAETLEAEYGNAKAENASTKVKLIVHPVNAGYKNTFLEAVSLCTGDVIFLSDQDDFWEKDKVKTMISLMEKQPEILVMNTNYTLMDQEGNSLEEGIKNGRRTKYKSNLTRVGTKAIMAYNLSMGCTMAFRKEIKEMLLKDMDFLQKSYLPHDWMVNLYGSMKQGLFYLNKPLIRYRLHGNNTIGLNRATTLDKRVEDYKDMLLQKRAMEQIFLVASDVAECSNCDSGCASCDSDCSACEKQSSDKFDELCEYMTLMIKSYEFRIKCLEGKKLLSYITGYVNKKYYRVLDKKTAMYDLYLLVKRR